jgi:hypothetical protein
MINVGRLVVAMTLATVKVLPLPVIPSTLGVISLTSSKRSSMGAF